MQQANKLIQADGIVAAHPWFPGKWTHSVTVEAMRARGCGVVSGGRLPLGVFRSLADANRHARALKTWKIMEAAK